MRLRLDLAYDGTAFSGWAAQPGRRTVQGVIESALNTLLRAQLRLVVAGRTDAGVHAAAQTAHCDLDAASAEQWQAVSGDAIHRLAGLLPPDVRVHAVAAAPAGFDARFSALWRRYRYRISDAGYGVDPLDRWHTVAWRRPLHTASMQAAADQLLGLHDFAAFCRRRDGATTIRALQELVVGRVAADRIDIDVRADAFCHSMVRSLVGALAAVGEGRRPVSWPATLLGATERSDSVAVAPAHGLTLVEVGYPAPAELAARARDTRSLRRFDAPPTG